jgi:hypothetical protein
MTYPMRRHHHWQLHNTCATLPLIRTPPFMSIQILIIGIHLARSTRGRICSPPKQRT